MSDCRFGVSPVNYPDPDPDPDMQRTDIEIQANVTDMLADLNWQTPETRRAKS